MNDVEENWQQQICKDNNSIMYEVDGILNYAPNQSMKTININSHGFRGDEFSEIKDSDTYRIFLVGGSTVFLATSDDNLPNILLSASTTNQDFCNVFISTDFVLKLFESNYLFLKCEQK